VSFFPNQSEAAIGCAAPGVTTYYTDASRTTIAGREVRGCCGEYSFTGRRTRFYRCDRFECLDVLCDD
jgi:hypothetical protein